MPTTIKLMDGDDVTVREGYREVYEKLLSAAWREPCEFTIGEVGIAGEDAHAVTVNPAYVVLIRG
ncbi:MAG TPA: hypothetical protein VFR97_08875 [Capillimicrobium sp.]|nr:hypothetical protein [Capillimicrobium sp.]